MYIFLGIVFLLISAVAFFYAMFSMTEFGGGNFLTPFIIAVVTLVLAIILISIKAIQKNATQATLGPTTGPIRNGHARNGMFKAGIILIIIGILTGVVYYILPGVSNTVFDAVIRSNRILAMLISGILVPFLIILGIILSIVGGTKR